MIHRPTPIMPTRHFSLQAIHLAATAMLMTVEVVRQEPIGPLQVKTTGAPITVALITTDHGGQEQGNENAVID